MSVRDKLEWARNHAPEPPAPQRPNTQGLTNIAMPTMSTRQRAELAAMEANPEVVAPQLRGGSGSHGEDNVAHVRTRDRQARAKTLAEMAQTPVNSRTALEQYYLDAHAEEVAQKEKWAREKAAKQAEINRKNDEREQFNRRMFPVRLMLDDNFANDRERQTIWRVATEHPEFSIDKLYATLLELRKCIAAATKVR